MSHHHKCVRITSEGKTRIEHHLDCPGHIQEELCELYLELLLAIDDFFPYCEPDDADKS